MKTDLFFSGGSLKTCISHVLAMCNPPTHSYLSFVCLNGIISPESQNDKSISLVMFLDFPMLMLKYPELFLEFNIVITTVYICFLQTMKYTWKVVGTCHLHDTIK